MDEITIDDNTGETLDLSGNMMFRAECTEHKVYSTVPVSKYWVKDSQLFHALEKRLFQCLQAYGCDCGTKQDTTIEKIGYE